MSLIIHFLLESGCGGVLATPLVKKLFPGLEPDDDSLEDMPALDPPPVTVITPKIDQVCGRLFKYYQNFRVEGHSLIGVGSSMEKAVEVHGASPRIRWVSDEIIPGYHKSVRVDDELYQVSASPGNLDICSQNCRSETLFLLSLMGTMTGLPLLMRV